MGDPLIDDDDQNTIDLEEAQQGRGTRYMPLTDARRFLEFCALRGWAFQSMEAFEVVDDREVLSIEYSIMGLTEMERNARTAEDLYGIALRRLDGAARQSNPFIFKVWIDTCEHLLS